MLSFLRNCQHIDCWGHRDRELEVSPVSFPSRKGEFPSRRKYFFRFTFSEVSVHDYSGLLPLDITERIVWKKRLLTSWWLGSKKRGKRGQASQYPL
jgi:hypothetical protein